MSTHLPTKFHAFIGGFFGTDYTIELDGQELVYLADETHSGEGRRERISPTGDEWNTFWKQLNELGVWEWKRKYETEICDGTQWELDIKYGDKKRKCYGSNAYPDRFDEYLQAVKELLGGREFS